MSKRHAPGARRARIGVTLPTKMLDRLDGLVDRESGQDRSEVVRLALADYILKRGR